MNCPDCFAAIPHGDHHCPLCGKEVAASDTAPAPGPADGGRGPLRSAGRALVALALLGAGIAAWHSGLLPGSRSPPFQLGRDAAAWYVGKPDLARPTAKWIDERDRLPPMDGAATVPLWLEPSGAELPGGARILFPLEARKEPGTTIHIAYLNRDRNRWQDTGETAVVDMTGLQAEGVVRHFSGFAGYDVPRTELDRGAFLVEWVYLRAEYEAALLELAVYVSEKYEEALSLGKNVIRPDSWMGTGNRLETLVRLKSGFAPFSDITVGADRADCLEAARRDFNVRKTQVDKALDESLRRWNALVGTNTPAGLVALWDAIEDLRMLARLRDRPGVGLVYELKARAAKVLAHLAEGRFEGILEGPLRKLDAHELKIVPKAGGFEGVTRIQTKAADRAKDQVLVPAFRAFLKAARPEPIRELADQLQARADLQVVQVAFRRVSPHGSMGLPGREHSGYAPVMFELRGDLAVETGFRTSMGLALGESAALSIWLKQVSKKIRMNSPEGRPLEDDFVTYRQAFGGGPTAQVHFTRDPKPGDNLVLGAQDLFNRERHYFIDGQRVFFPDYFLAHRERLRKEAGVGKVAWMRMIQEGNLGKKTTGPVATVKKVRALAAIQGLKHDIQRILLEDPWIRERNEGIAHLTEVLENFSWFQKFPGLAMFLDVFNDVLQRGITKLADAAAPNVRTGLLRELDAATARLAAKLLDAEIPGVLPPGKSIYSLVELPSELVSACAAPPPSTAYEFAKGLTTRFHPEYRPEAESWGKWMIRAGNYTPGKEQPYDLTTHLWTGPNSAHAGDRSLFLGQVEREWKREREQYAKGLARAKKWGHPTQGFQAPTRSEPEPDVVHLTWRAPYKVRFIGLYYYRNGYLAMHYTRKSGNEAYPGPPPALDPAPRLFREQRKVAERILEETWKRGIRP